MKSTKPKVILTYPLNPDVIEKKLKPYASVILCRSRSQLKKEIMTADALICLLSDPIDSELLSKSKNLKVIGNYAVGYDNIDLKACKKKQIKVVNTPKVLTRSTAELTCSLLFACARRFYEAEKLCRSGKFKGWDPNLLQGLELKGRNAVIVGKGRIGQETGKLFRALGLKVHYLTRHSKSAEINRTLKKAQVLTFHVPYKESTHHWLTRTRIELLPKDCIVLNTSRGSVIDEKALIQSLKKNKIYAAGLDVFEKEPFIPAELRRLKNVVLLPHIGSSTIESRRQMAELVITGVLAILGGHSAWNQVN